MMSAMMATPASDAAEAVPAGAANDAAGPLLVGTRIHGSARLDERQEGQLRAMLRVWGACVAVAVEALVCMGGSGPVAVSGASAGAAAEDDAKASDAGHRAGVGELVNDVLRVVLSAGGQEEQVIPVSPWGRFVPALNALLSRARMRDCAYLLLVSLEVHVSREEVQSLQAELEEDTESTALVVGLRLPGHNFVAEDADAKRQPGSVTRTTTVLTGRTTPWNTCALWDTRKLALTGFPLVAEGLLAGTEGGVEEVAAITLLQHILSPSRAVAKLLSLPHQLDGRPRWDTAPWEKQGREIIDGGSSADGDDGQLRKRRDWHARKMASKESRAAGQLHALGVHGSDEEYDADTALPRDASRAAQWTQPVPGLVVHVHVDNPSSLDL